jgi:hypothetical protein
MIVLELTRKMAVGDEIYGRISYDGTNCVYSGLSSVFTKYLDHGIMGSNHKLYKPSDGEAFLEILKYQFNGSEVTISEIIE